MTEQKANSMPAEGKTKGRILRVFAMLLVAALGIALVLWCAKTEPKSDDWLKYGILASLGLGLLALAPRRFPKAVSVILSVLIPVAAFYLGELLFHDPLMIVRPVRLMEYAIHLLLFFFLFALTGRMRVGYILGVLFVAFVQVANYYVLDFRANPILPWDLSSLGIAMSVADNFVFQGSFELMRSVLGFLALLLLASRCDLRIRTGKVRVFWTALLFIVSFVFCRAIQTEPVKKAAGVYEMPFTQWYVYQKNGFFVSFIVNAKYLEVNVPEGYSEAAAEEDLQSMRGEEAGETPLPPQSERPNIIVIMDEAFSDLSVLGDFETNKKLMPFIKETIESDEVISGWLAVSVLGGNTANTEFEFLTGLSMAFVPAGSVPFQQFIQHETPSLASQLKEYGYQTLAMHPYGASGWNRNVVYPLLGFERMMFKPDFTEKAGIRNYTSDGAVVRQIIREYEAKEEGKPLFAFAVTMQNHGSYSKDYENFTPDVKVTSPNLGSLPKAEKYLTLLRWTDAAMKKLVEYFREADEKTIIVFFGDHQPTLLENKFWKALLGKNTWELTWQEQVPRYEVPFFIWANYDLGDEARHGVFVSANYLQTILLEAAGLPKTEFQEYLSGLQSEIPILTAGFYLDQGGGLHEVTEEKIANSELLMGYVRLQYNDLFDVENRLKGFSE